MAGHKFQTGVDVVGDVEVTGLVDGVDVSTLPATIAAVAAGVDHKDAVATSTEGEGNIALTGEQTFNSVLTSASRVAVVEQTNPIENGFWLSDAGAWTRTTDADEDAEVTNGMLAQVSNTACDVNGHGYLLTSPNPVVVGTDAMTFTVLPGLEFGDGAGQAIEGTNTRVPTQDENDALVGTSGSPSTSNKYVTDGDPRNSDSRDPNNHASNHTDGTDDIQDSSETAKGIIELATQGETDTGTDDVRAITALKLATTPLAGRDTDAIHDDVSAEISAVAPKVAVVAADLVLIEDSESTNAKKSAQVGNLSGAIDHDGLTNYDVVQHRVIDDAGAASATKLYSSSKIATLLGALSAGIDHKDAVATSTEGLGNITLSGEQTLNGVLTSTSRIAVVEQSDPIQNGFFITDAGAWTRTTDFDEDAEVTNGSMTRVANTASDVNGNAYILTSADPIAVGTDALNFTTVQKIEFGSIAGTATEGNDARLPTQDENDALVGTGTPSSSNVFVTADRGVIAGAGLTGGGDLTADRTFDVANADGSLTVTADDVKVGALQIDAQHGVRGGGTQHADVVAAGADGFMTGADKTILDDLQSNALLDGDFAGTYTAHMRRTGAGAYVALKDNLTATTDPGATDDSASDYGVGSLWINVTADRIHRCVNAGVGVAIWLVVAELPNVISATALATRVIAGFADMPGMTYTVLAGEGGAYALRFDGSVSGVSVAFQSMQLRFAIGGTPIAGTTHDMSHFGTGAVVSLGAGLRTQGTVALVPTDVVTVQWNIQVVGGPNVISVLKRDLALVKERN